MPKTKKLSNFLTNWSYLTIATTVQLLVSFITVVFVVKLIGLREYGLLTLIASGVACVNAFFECRLQDIAILHLAKDNPNLSTDHQTRRVENIVGLFWIDGILKLLGCVFSVALLPLILKNETQASQATSVIIINSVAFFLGRWSFNLFNGALRAINKTKLILIISTIDCGTKAISLTIVELAIGLSVSSYSVTILACGFLTNLFQCIVVLRILKINTTILFQIQKNTRDALYEWREILTGNLWVSITDLAVKDLDTVVMSGFVGLQSIGAYRYAKNIALVGWRFIDQISLALLPEMVKSINNKTNEPKTRLPWICFKILSLTAIGMASVYLLLSRIVIHKLPRFHDTEIQQIVDVMVIGITIATPFVWGPLLANSMKKPSYLVAGNLISTLLGIPVFIVLTKYFSIVGAAIGWSFLMVLYFLSTAILSLFNLINRRRTSIDSD